MQLGILYYQIYPLSFQERMETDEATCPAFCRALTI
jgi:hypothetical protein